MEGIIRRHLLLWATLGLVWSLPAGERAATPPPIRQLSVRGAASANPSIDAQGTFVAVAWGATRAAGGTDVYVAVSEDAGATFREAVRANAEPGEARLGAERPPVVVVVPGRKRVPDVAVLWTAGRSDTLLKLARSTDGGRSFGAPRLVHAAGVRGNRGWASMAADAAGGLHVVWLDHRDTAGASTTGMTHVHGTAASAPTAAPAARDGVAAAQRSGLYYASVGDGPVTEQLLTRGVCYCCKTAVAAASGSRVATAWRHVYPGNLRDIAAMASTDGGRTFAGPQRVSEDGWAIDGCPENGPSLALGDGGRLHLAWPTVLAGLSPTGAIFYADSPDGRRFSPRVRIPTLAGRDPEHVQIEPAGAGLVVAWDEVVQGKRVVVASRLAPGAQSVRVEAPVVVSAGRQGRHPSAAATARGVLLAWTDGPAGAATTIGVGSLPD